MWPSKHEGHWNSPRVLRLDLVVWPSDSGGKENNSKHPTREPNPVAQTVANELGVE
jgi:hypothetical protein